MSLLASYLRRQYKLLLLLAGFFCIFAAVFSLYTLPVEAVAYAGLLCFLLGAGAVRRGIRLFPLPAPGAAAAAAAGSGKGSAPAACQGVAGGGLSVSGPGAVPRPGKTRHGK